MTDEAQSSNERKGAESTVAIAVSVVTFLYFAFPHPLALALITLEEEGFPIHFLMPVIAPGQWLYENAEPYRAYVDWISEQLGFL